MDPKQKARVCDALSANGIAYTVKAIRLQRGSRAVTGSYGVRQDLVWAYRIYVHRMDYDRALHLI